VTEFKFENVCSSASEGHCEKDKVNGVMESGVDIKTRKPHLLLLESSSEQGGYSPLKSGLM
jgi:hypothetical protein